jgi:nucleoside-diphosphate-sugar epimerase
MTSDLGNLRVALLGFEPKFALRDGLARTIEDFRERLPASSSAR